MHDLKTFADYQTESHETAMLKGWWDQERDVGTLLMLVVSEIAEAMEEYRKYGLNPGRLLYANRQDEHGGMYVGAPDEHNKAEGIAAELADAVIRIMDMCEHLGIPLELAMRVKQEFNRHRPYRHGGKAA